LLICTTPEARSAVHFRPANHTKQAFYNRDSVPTLSPSFLVKQQTRRMQQTDAPEGRRRINSETQQDRASFVYL